MMKQVRHGSLLVQPKTLPRTPAAPTDQALFRAHLEGLRTYTDALREGRCRRTNHFDERLEETLSVFGPIFAPWNTEILFVLYMRGPLRFNAIKRGLGRISSRVLTDKLQHLQKNVLVRRAPEGRAVRYELSAVGEVVARHLHPLLFFLNNRLQPVKA